MLIDTEALMAEPLLSAEDEVLLAERIEAGLLAREARLTGRLGGRATDAELLALEELGESARQRYIRANLRLVAQQARRLAARTGLSDADLFQEGCLGLICAVERFDHRRGYRFSTYATFWVRAYTTSAAARLGALSLPGGRASQLRTARAVEGELTQSLGRVPSSAELAALLGRTPRWTARLMASQAPQSLDALGDSGVDVATSVDSEGLGTEGSGEGPPGVGLLDHLDELEREVVALRYGFRNGVLHTYVEIAAALGITRSRARRLEHRGLEVLRSVCPRNAVAYLS